MVGVGILMILISLFGLIFQKRGTLSRHTGLLKLMMVAIFFPYISNTAGWIMSEIGRQPWVVYELMTTEAGLSPSVTSGEILFSLISFTVVYTLLMIAMIYLFVRVAKRGAVIVDQDEPTIDPFTEGSEGRVG